MVTKTKRVKNVTKVKARDFSLPESLNNQPDEFTFIPRYKIHPSPTNPRKRLDPKTINELAESIKQKGILEPLLVRRNSDGFELVCGERRWRASDIANLEIVPVIIKDLSDAEVLDIQIHENLHREDVHPLDEALGYKYLMETVGLTLTDLALKVGKPESFVHQRLKLNELCDEAQKDFLEGLIPIGHALEIAKYSLEKQQVILKNCVYHWGQKDHGVYPLDTLKNNIDRQIHLNLSKAPFSLKSTELRKDGLSCENCPNRTGAHPTLFQIDDGKKQVDNCLDKECFNSKKVNSILLRQKKLSAEVIKDTGDPDYKTALISDYYSPNTETFPDVLGTREYELIEDGTDKCPHREKAILIDSDNYGETKLICRNINCEKHGKQIKTPINRAENPEEATAKKQEERKIRKEEIFDIKIAAKVRYRILKECAEKFEGLKNIELENLQTLVQRLWDLQESRESTVMEVFAPYLAKIIGIEEKENSYLSHEVSRALSSGYSLSEKNKLRDLAFDDLRKIAFLLFYGHLNPLYFLDKRSTPYVSDRYASQKLVKEMAEEYQVDWKKFDAEERLALAPM